MCKIFSISSNHIHPTFFHNQHCYWEGRVEIVFLFKTTPLPGCLHATLGDKIQLMMELKSYQSLTSSLKVSNILSLGEILAIFQGCDVCWIDKIIILIMFQVVLLGYQDNPWMDMRTCGITNTCLSSYIELCLDQHKT